MSTAEQNDFLQGIAIIGMSGRFPGAKSVSDLWENLCGGKESISFFNREELTAAGRDASLLANPHLVPAGGVLDDAEFFDAPFFGLSPREAEIIDPQQRVFLECAWQALEDAGYDPEAFAGSIGIYAGANSSTYLNNILSHPELVSLIGGFQVTVGNDKDYLTTQASYKLNLKGPSVAIQTACSTSLVTVCMACESLLDHHCDMALAGGVAIKVPQKSGYLYQEGMINSPDGHCRPFDADARGTVFGNGIGLVVLKRLADAITDGDHIYAVIKGSAINNDGALKVGFTAPSVAGQAEVIVLAQAVAEVDPESITYIEAHGTATPLGDPIEIAALTQAFRSGTDKKNFCRIGSIKSNIGHLNTAAGIAGLMKTALMLKHRMVPPSLHFKRANPAIDFENSPFVVNDKLTAWEAGEAPRRAGVSSFGIGGTNAHAILEEAPAPKEQNPSRPAQLLLLSAKTSTALEHATTNLANFLDLNRDSNLPDSAYTTKVGRRAFKERRMLVCHDHDDAATALRAVDPKRVLTGTASSARSVVFMFPGQGSQYVNMGRDLYETEPTFRRNVDECSELLRPLLSLDLRQLLYPRDDEASDKLGQTIFSQPALFVVEYSLAQLWLEWGVTPRAMIGHSVGEYVAACLSGVFTVEDALALIAARGRMMQQMPGGSMLAVALPEQEVAEFLSGGLDLAAVNASSLCVVSGSLDAVAQLEARLKVQGKTTQRLHTSHAFHSQMMDPLLEQFTNQAAKIQLSAPRVPYISNLTGDWITAAEATDPNYWANHLRHTVRFAEGLQNLRRDADAILLEVGPGETLTSLARQQARSTQQIVIPSVRRPHVRQSDVDVLLQAAGRLWLAGQNLDWSGFYRYESRKRVSLPSYAFDRHRYWIEPRPPEHTVSSPATKLQKRDTVSDWFYGPTWTHTSDFPNPEFTSAATWLLFSDSAGVGSKVIERLRKENQNVLVVTAGDSFQSNRDGAYTLDPTKAEQYRSLVQSLRSSGSIPNHVVHIWSVAAAAPTLAESQERGFYSMLYLAQALAAEDVTSDLILDVVSEGLHLVTGDESLKPANATVLGTCKVIAREFPNLRCRNLDLSFSSAGQHDIQLINQLLAELANTNSDDEVVALRGNQRWVRNWKAVEVSSARTSNSPLKEGGVYLITGGLGGIGFVLAQHLARSLKAKLILTGRTVLPAREEWPSHLASNVDLARRIRRIQELEAEGAEVMLASADVCSEHEMRSVVHQAQERFGPINGVIHAAGIAGGGIIQLKNRATAANVLLPKVQGTLVLDDIFAGADLDFMVLCSSLASLLAGAGQADYCAANCFLDAFAQAKAKQGRRVISINWDTWQEVGMAVETPLPDDLQVQRNESLKTGILKAEGIEAFNRILVSGLPQVAVSTIDLRTRLQRYKDAAGSSSEREAMPRQVHTGHARPELGTTYAEPTDRIEESIARLWQELLGVEQVGINDDFFELGGHSLLAVRMMAEIEKSLGQRIPLASLFENSNVAALARILRRDVKTLEWPTLVEIQRSGSKLPLFCVSTPNVNALGYKSLARWLGEDQPVFGLQAQYPEDLEGEHSQSAVERLAVDYLTALRELQPAGPYQFVGLCRGAHIAYEMARTLEQQGERVALLAILDTWVLENTYNRFLYVEYYAKRLRSFFRGGVSDQLKFVREKVKRRRNPGETNGHHHQSRNPMAAYFPGPTFSPKTYNGDITVLRVGRQPLNRIRDPQLGWGLLTSGHVDVRIISGNHNTVLREPSVRNLAEELKKVL